ncbi:helix-turn-helix domain-containing protein [Enterococcus sp. AZ102]|uniref:helix-turn-helix domain-containing protein n=1 Tax=Enterococcus sp. AZ102 TaxID=2774865 RepID=UPI003F258EDA
MLREQDTNKHNMLWFVVENKLKELNITQSELSRRSGLNTTVISAIKLGKIKKPSFSLICKLSEGLEMELDDFKQIN